MCNFSDKVDKVGKPHNEISMWNIEQGVESFTSSDFPFGESYGLWTTKWWQWALGTPSAVNPVLDKTGIHSDINQSGDVWFLAGKFGSENKDIPERSCSIPHGKGILFPVLNCEANPIEYTELATDQDIINHVVHDVDSVALRNCFLNGKSIKPERITSDPMIFELTIPKDNPLGLEKAGTTRAAADGYWVFLKPTSASHLSIYFEGSCENGRLYSGARYSITIS